MPASLVGSGEEGGDETLRCRGGSCASVYAWRCNCSKEEYVSIGGGLCFRTEDGSRVCMARRKPAVLTADARAGSGRQDRGRDGGAVSFSLTASFEEGRRAYRMVLPVRRRIHWGIGRFCFWALASFCLVRNDLWLCSGKETPGQPVIPLAQHFPEASALYPPTPRGG